MSKKHQDSTLQRAMIKHRLSEKDVQIQELHQAISEMSGSMMALKDQLAHRYQGALHSPQKVGPTFVARIPDVGSIATAPRFPIGWVRGDDVTTSGLALANALMDTPYINVEIPMSDTAELSG